MMNFNALKSCHRHLGPLGCWLVLLLAVLLTGCASPRAHTARPPQPPNRNYTKGPAIGTASYYAREFHGRRTASGETYNMYRLTAAHRTFPFGTNVRVTNLVNQQSVVVRINDRGPFARNRIIDVSLEAARQLQMTRAGKTRVRIDPL